VRLGYVTPEKALPDYRVAVADDGTVDRSATMELRSREAAA
jgi:hypothetical protein